MFRVKLYKGGILKLPAKVRRRLGLKEGDELLITVEDGAIRLVPARLADPVEAYSSELGGIDEEVLEEGLREAIRSMRKTPPQ